MTWLETLGLFFGAFLLALIVGSLIVLLDMRRRRFTIWFEECEQSRE